MLLLLRFVRSSVNTVGVCWKSSRSADSHFAFPRIPDRLRRIVTRYYYVRAEFLLKISSDRTKRFPQLFHHTLQYVRVRRKPFFTIFFTEIRTKIIKPRQSCHNEYHTQDEKHNCSSSHCCIFRSDCYG